MNIEVKCRGRFCPGHIRLGVISVTTVFKQTRGDHQGRGSLLIPSLFTGQPMDFTKSLDTQYTQAVCPQVGNEGEQDSIPAFGSPRSHGAANLIIWSWQWVNAWLCATANSFQKTLPVFKAPKSCHMNANHKPFVFYTSPDFNC